MNYPTLTPAGRMPATTAAGTTNNRCIPRWCDCGKPAAKGGQACASGGGVDNRCERCARIEESRRGESRAETYALLPKDGGRRREGDYDALLPHKFIVQLDRACEAFFARRGLLSPGRSELLARDAAYAAS